MELQVLNQRHTSSTEVGLTVANDADITIAIDPTPENRIELANIGDVNDDGRSDVLLGGTGLQAHAYLFWGGLALREDLSMADADLLFMPEDSDDQVHQLPLLATSTTMASQISLLALPTMTVMDGTLEKYMSILVDACQNLVS